MKNRIYLLFSLFILSCLMPSCAGNDQCHWCGEFGAETANNFDSKVPESYEYKFCSLKCYADFTRYQASYGK